MALLIKYELLLHSSTQGVDVQKGFKATLKSQRLELRTRVTRLLIAVLVGTLFVPVGSIGITALIDQAHAVDYNITCSNGGSFTVTTGTTIKSGNGASCKGVVTIPEGITQLEGAAFSTGGAMANANPFITEIRFPSTLTNTGDYGLGRLTGLTSLIVPGGAKIGIGSLRGLTSLTELTINGGTVSAPTRTDYTTTQGVNAGKSSGFVPQRLVLGNGYTNLRQEAFVGDGSTEVIFGSGTYYVGTGNFVTASSLQAIDFGTSTSPAITLATQNVTLAAANPYGFNETEQNAFQGSSIRSVRNCDTNASSAFNLRLKAITNDLSQTLYSLSTCNNNLPTITNLNPPSTSGGTPPASVTITGTNFQGLVGLRGVMFGSTPAASYTVTSATSITAVPPASVTSGTYSLTVNTFAGASKPVVSCSGGGTISINSETSTTNNSCLGSVDLSATGITTLNGTFNTSQNVTEVKLPNTLQIISGNAFYNTGIAKLVLPPSITSICEACISGNQKLTSVEMSGSPSVPVSFGSRTFQNNGVLQRVSFGYSADTSLNLTSYTSSSVFMFQGSTKLTTVNSCAASGSYLATFLAGVNASDTANPKRINTFNGSTYPTVGCGPEVAVTGGGTTTYTEYPAVKNFTATNSGTSVTLTSEGILSSPTTISAIRYYMSTDNYTWTEICSYLGEVGGTTQCVKSGLTSGTTYYFRFKAFGQNGYDTTYKPDITVTIPIVSSVATLSNLTLSSGTLSPTFDSATETYTASVANAVDSVTVTATKSNLGANTVQYLGATGTTPFTGALAVGSNVIRTVVTAGDGITTKTYTVTVTRAASTVATLLALAASAGTLSPTFASGTETYTVSVANSVVSTTITPTRTQANATITVNGTLVTSGSASGAISLNVGSNTINVVVTAQDGATTKTYTVTVTRALSAIATLSNLTLSSGTLSPTFASGTTSYTASVANSVSSITVTPTVTQANATTVQYLGATGTNLFTGALSVGSNVIRTVVTAQDGITFSTYTVTVTRAASAVATLSNLVLSSGTLNPTFASGTTSYTASVANSVSSITVTPTVTQANATTVQYLGATGTNLFTGALSVGSNVIRTVVTAQDGITFSTYTVTVTRAASAVATLSNLVLSSGTLNPTFASGTTSYTASVANSVSSITVTPTVTQANATTVQYLGATGTNLFSGVLSVGANVIRTVVTAQDGTTKKTYTVTVTRISNDATLSALALSSGTLNPTFASGTESYTASVANSVTSITVTPTRTQANATITVNGTSVTSGAASGSISLNVGSNTITVVVTAQDGTTTKTYTVTVTRLSSDATLSALALSAGTLSPTFDSGTASYTASVGNSVSSITITPTIAQADATTVQYLGATGTTVFTGSLAVGPNVIRTVVTAQDGTTRSTYTVTVTRLSNDATLSNSSVIKGQAPTLGVPNASLGSETAGTLTLTTAQATGSAATTFALSNATATITKIVKFAAGSQVSDFETETAFSNGSLAQITTGDFFVIQVTAGDGSVRYTRVNVTVNSNIATLSNTSVIKGQTPTFGVPNTTLGSETAGTLTLTTTQATGAVATTFVLTNSSATISKIVKFASGSQVSAFDSASAFTNGSTAQISTGDFFVIKVTAADGTINYTRVNVTVNSNVASFSAFNLNALTPSVIGTLDNTLNTVQLVVPVGTNVTNLVAAFTFSEGASVTVAGTAQISGTTSNNFSSPVTYVVTSQDSSTVRSYSVTVTIASNPSAPQNLTASGGQGTASLSWSAPSSDGGRPVTGYVIESSLDSTNWTSAGNTNASTTSLTISSLPNNTTYYFRVRATNVSGSTSYNYSSVASTNTYYYITCSVSGSFYVSSSTIPSYAGRNCKGTATIPQGVTRVLVAAFAPGTGSTPGDVNRDLTALVFPASGFAQIDQGGFRNLGLTSLTIPASIIMVGLSAFENNPLTSVTVTGGSGGASTVLSQGAFSNQGFGLSTAIALTLGSGKIEISNNFGVKTTFSTVDFGAGLRSIDQQAFKSNGIAPGWVPFFPSTITSIASEAFRYSPNLTTIRFGTETTTSITLINEWAFDKNYLKSIQYCGPRGDANALSRYLRDFQQNAKIWCDFIAPNAPAITTSSQTNQQVSIGWAKGADRNEPLTDTFTVQYKSGSGSWTTLSFETATPLSLTISGLTNGTTYTFRVAANNIAGASPFSSEVQVTPLGLALIPTPDTSTATAGGFTFNITNYSSQSNWSASVTAGSGTVSLGTAVGNVLPVTVTNMNPGATVSVRITTTRTNYETGTADTAGTSLISALTPTFGTASLTTNGYTVAITNYDANYNWSVIPSSGTAQIVSGSVRVTGAAFATSVTATVTATRTGYVTGSANFSATTLAALTATYYGNGNTGGSVPSDTSTYQTNATFAVLGNSGTLIRPGYTFAGWKDNLGADYQPAAQYALANAGVSFYAQWTANPYRVFYNLTEATSGTVPTDANIYAITSTANVRGNPGNLQRTGYVFAGWADNANRNGRIYVSGDTYTVQTSDINFWAAWTPNTYTITYDVNGATGSPSKSSDSYTVGSSVARLALVGTLAKSGYNFGGWATQAVGTPISDSFTVAANTKLIAQWNIASFTLTYDLDGGTGTVDTPTAVNYLQQFNLAPATGFTKSSGGISYAFVAWSANSATYNLGQSYIMPAANLTFTATWTRIYNVTYSFSGGSASPIADQQKIALDTITVTSTIPTRTGYTFLRWVDQSGETTTAGATYTVRDGHYLLYAQWQAVSYSVTYDVAGGSSAPSESAKTIGQSFLVGAAPTREFYNFNGWFDGTNTYFPGATYVTQSSNITFTAQWQGKEFRVSYDFNGGAGNVGGSYLHTYGSSAYLLPTTGISLTDYNFGGWATSPGGTSVGATFAPSSDISLYAIWNIAIYRLSFDGRSGISESATAKVTIGQSIALPNATRANHTLQGWSTQQSGGSITAAGASFTPNADAILYAQWALQVFTVTFNANGGTSESATAAFTYGSTTPLVLPRATRVNYVFDNWYSSASGGYLIGAGGGNFTPTGSVTIYAHWIQASLEGLGDAVKIAEVTVLAGSSSSFSAGSQGSTASVEYTADSLPDGTVITAYVQKTTSRVSSIIDSGYNYVLSIVVAWLAPDGTVPDTAVGKPIVVTVTNQNITKGSRIYKLVGTTPRVLGTATENGRFQALLTQDPLVTVAITEPDSPTAVSAVALDQESALVSWQAPEVNGGSPISGYTATSSGGQSCITVTTSCTITGLSANTSYTFSVLARNVIGASLLRAGQSSITTSAAPVVVTENTNNNTNNSGGTYDPSAAIAAAQQQAAQAAAAAQQQAAQAAAAAELKAAEEKAAAELKAAGQKAAEEKVAAELKAAEEKAAAEVKAQEEAAAVVKAAEDKAKADAELAAQLAAKKITPAVSLYSISPKLTLSAYDLAYMKKYLSTLKKNATVTCIGYTYTQKTTLAKATVLAKKQANAVCSIVKKTRPTLKTSILIRPAKSAPKAAVGAKWVAISYRVDGYQPKK